MEELKYDFDKYIEALKGTDTKFKRKELIDSIKELIYIFDTIAQADGVELHYLKSKEIIDLTKENVSEDDFLEAAIVYLENAKNIIGEYLDTKL
ncbi:MAG: hypothetical protein IJD92_00465 [Bacilli bacterium]|nr:hypothetical protein [Bacilli bacterium]